MTNRLIFCRTPFQTLLVPEIQQQSPARDTIIYQPTSASPKHATYFERLQADRKVFLPWLSRKLSWTLTEIRSYFTIPREIRRRPFDSYLVSSFDSLVFAMLHGRSNAKIDTYDDGTMYLLPSEMQLRLEHEDRAHAHLKRLLGLKQNRDVLMAASTHYSVYPADWSLVPHRRITPLRLLDDFSSRAAGRQLTIFIGAPIEILPGPTTDDILKTYDRLLTEVQYDIFIPHPAEAREAFVGDRVSDAENIRDMVSSLIAEDVILHLLRTGHELTIYGISSTVLVNLARAAQCINLLVPGANDREASVFERFGVPSIPVADLLDRLSSQGQTVIQ